MPNTSDTSSDRPDVEGIEARANSATQGEFAGGQYTRAWGYPLLRAHGGEELLASFLGTRRQAESNAQFFDKARQDIPALITYINALERNAIAVIMETDFAIQPASGKPWVTLNGTGPAHRKLRDLLAGLKVPDDEN